MQAEDRYGQGGYQCASPSNEMTSIFLHELFHNRCGQWRVPSHPEPRCINASPCRLRCHKPRSLTTVVEDKRGFGLGVVYYNEMTCYTLESNLKLNAIVKNSNCHPCCPPVERSTSGILIQSNSLPALHHLRHHHHPLKIAQGHRPIRLCRKSRQHLRYLQNNLRISLVNKPYYYNC